MRNLEARIDELLEAWHRHRSSWALAKGYSNTDATCRDFRTPGHWDWRNGAEDARADRIEVDAVDAAMDQVPNAPRRWRTALEFHARNLVTGAAVWRSPVLPQEPAEREVLLLEAKNKLVTALYKAGTLT